MRKLSPDSFVYRTGVFCGGTHYVCRLLWVLRALATVLHIGPVIVLNDLHDSRQVESGRNARSNHGDGADDGCRRFRGRFRGTKQLLLTGGHCWCEVDKQRK